MTPKSKWIAVALTLVATASASAVELRKGTCLLSAQLTSGTADVAVGSDAAGFITAVSTSEVGVQGQFWYLMADDYGLAIAGGAGFSRETDEPGTGAAADAAEVKFKTNSFHVRVGGDRVVKVGERALMYGGPGIEFWSGKPEVESGSTTFEGERTNRISLSARIGATIVLSDVVGLNAQVGHHLGRASAEDQGAKATWWPSGFDGTMGFMLMFGAK